MFSLKNPNDHYILRDNRDRERKRRLLANFELGRPFRIGATMFVQ